MIRLNKISKSFNHTKAISDLEIIIESAKTTVIIGPSGCGKSTLIRLIVGLLPCDTGEIYIEEELLTPENILQIRHKIGYVIQEGGLFPHLTARGNISLLANYLKWDKHRIHQRISELADLTKFPLEALDRYPRQLSGGQQQRISLMRALMLDPPILLLDEPLGSLDPMIRYDLQKDLKNIFSSLHKTVLMVTHDLSEADYFADEIILMKDGGIVQNGLIADFRDKPAKDFVTRFIKAQRYLPDISGGDSQ